MVRSKETYFDPIHCIPLCLSQSQHRSIGGLTGNVLPTDLVLTNLLISCEIISCYCCLLFNATIDNILAISLM